MDTAPEERADVALIVNDIRPRSETSQAEAGQVVVQAATAEEASCPHGSQPQPDSASPEPPPSATEASKMQPLILIASFSLIMGTFGIALTKFHSQSVAARVLSRISLGFECAALIVAVADVFRMASSLRTAATGAATGGERTGFSKTVLVLWLLSFVGTAATVMVKG